jgi:MspA
VLTVSAVMPPVVVLRRATVLAVCIVISAAIAPSAGADPDAAPAAPDATPPTDGRVPSGVPAIVNTPDGWSLTLGAKDESQIPVPPLTTAISSREYLASGTFSGSLAGPEEPRGVLEVGYEIGCGIDMSTSNGVTMAGSGGMTPSLGVSGPLGALPTAVLPVVSTPVNGVITVGLKPGIVIVVPIDKKEFKGANPWVMISNFHVKIDGCVGQSFIRSYATLTRQTDQSDVVLSYVGVTTSV